MKAASSVERALAVHARRDVLLSMCAAVRACCRQGMLPSGYAQATPSTEEVIALLFGGLILPVWNNVRWSQKNCVTCCMIPQTKTESMVCLWSWLKRMCTRGMMQWNSFRKKLKESSSSSLTNLPASRTVVGSNSPNGFKTLDDVTFVLKHCSLHRYGSSILLCLLLGVCVPPLFHTHWFSWKKSRESSQVREELINRWDVRCHLLHDESWRGGNCSSLGSCCCACPSGASAAKSVSPTSEIRPSAESQQDFLHVYVYIVYVKWKMWDPN